MTILEFLASRPEWVLPLILVASCAASAWVGFKIRGKR